MSFHIEPQQCLSGMFPKKLPKEIPFFRQSRWKKAAVQNSNLILQCAINFVVLCENAVLDACTAAVKFSTLRQAVGAQNPEKSGPGSYANCTTWQAGTMSLLVRILIITPSSFIQLIGCAMWFTASFEGNKLCDIETFHTRSWSHYHRFNFLFK